MPDDKLPDVAVVDAACGPIYPGMMSGCGVGFKLAGLLSATVSFPKSNHCSTWWRSASPPTSSLMVRTGDDSLRVEAAQLQPQLRLRGLSICGLQRKQFTVSDIVFKIGPGSMFQADDERRRQHLMLQRHGSAREKVRILIVQHDRR